MQDNNKTQNVDELIDRIDSFMQNGGGHMNVKVNGGESEIHEIKETRCTTCCGETADTVCNTPAK